MYLRKFDYKISMQTNPLAALEQSDHNVLQQAERYAEELIKSRLAQKFDFSLEFTSTDTFVFNKVYNGYNRAYLDFPVYDPSKTYPTIGSIASIATGANQGQWVSIAAIGTPEAFTPAHWKLVGQLNDIFYIALPAPAFNVLGKYLVGDKVFYKNKIYQAILQSAARDHQSVLNAIEYSNIGFPNFFPDDTVNGFKQWGVGVAYSVNCSIYDHVLYPNSVPTDFPTWSAGSYSLNAIRNYGGVIYFNTLANNTAIPGADLTWLPITWTAGDNRCQEILKGYVDVSLWRMSSAMAPRSVPEYLQRNYEDFTGINDEKGVKIQEGWIDQAKRGDVIPNLILTNPTYIGVAFGGTTKANNNF